MSEKDPAKRSTSIVYISINDGFLNVRPTVSRASRDTSRLMIVSRAGSEDDTRPETYLSNPYSADINASSNSEHTSGPYSSHLQPTQNFQSNTTMAYQRPVSSSQRELQGSSWFEYMSFMPREGTAGSEFLVTVQPSHDLSAMPFLNLSLSFQERRVPLQITSRVPSKQYVLFDFRTRVPAFEFLASDSFVPLDLDLADPLGRL